MYIGDRNEQLTLEAEIDNNGHWRQKWTVDTGDRNGQLTLETEMDKGQRYSTDLLIHTFIRITI